MFCQSSVLIKTPEITNKSNTMIKPLFPKDTIPFHHNFYIIPQNEKSHCFCRLLRLKLFVENNLVTHGYNENTK